MSRYGTFSALAFASLFACLSGTCILDAITVGGTELEGKATWTGGALVEIDVR